MSEENIYPCLYFRQFEKLPQKSKNNNDFALAMKEEMVLN